MAVKVLYFLNTAATSPNWFGSMQEGGVAPGAAVTTAGFNPAKTAVTTPYFRGRWGASAKATAAQAASYIDSTSGPAKGTGATITTAGDSFITPSAYSGTFAAGAWTLTLSMRPSTVTVTGRLRMRVWASQNADGTSARELTSGALAGSINTQSSTTTTYTAGLTWSPGAITLNSEYIFFQIEWQETTAGTASGSATGLYLGTALVTTTDFAASIVGTANIALAPVTVPAAVVPSSLLHFEGTDGSQVIDDETSHTWTAVGNAQIDTAQSKIGSSSLLLDGTGDYLTGDGGSDFAFGGGDFTIDFWFRHNNPGTTQVLYDSRPSGTPTGNYIQVYINATNLPRLYHGSAHNGTTALVGGQWHHIAVTRSGSSLRFFVNGTQEGVTLTNSNTFFVGASRPTIGCDGNTIGASPLNGWVDAVRVVKGTALWTSNFSPPAAIDDYTAYKGTVLIAGTATPTLDDDTISCHRDRPARAHCGHVGADTRRAHGHN